MIVSNYTKLFSIEFLHDAYKDHDDILRDISIVPDAETSRILSGNRLSTKFIGNELFCFVQTIASINEDTFKVTTENKPLIDLDENEQLSFKINISFGRFLNNSNLRFFDSKNKIYSFSNESSNKQTSGLYLSKKIPVYSSAENYKTGSLVKDASDKTFEAIDDSDASNIHDTTDNLFWKAVTLIDPTDQLVNQQDLFNDSDKEKCFAAINISFQKNLANEFSLLKSSAVEAENNLILGKDYVIHFKKNEAA